MLAHALAFGGGRIARAHRGADRRERHATLRGQFADLGQRNFEVLPNVITESLERRDIDDARFLGQLAGACFANQFVEADQKSGQMSCPTRWARRSERRRRRGWRASPESAARWES